MPTPKPKPRPFANHNNIDFINALRNELGDDFRARIPVLTRANFDKVMHDLDNYIPGQNAILSAMINKVGMTKFSTLQWESPLREFFKGSLRYGESVEDVVFGLVQARAYDTDRETGERVLFGRNDIEMATSYYQRNRENRYDITIDNKGGEVTKAFHNEDGLSSYIDGIMAALYTSASFDEFILMANLISHYEDMGGFYKVNVPDLKTSADRKAAATTLLESIREHAAEFAYPSRRFNAAGMPTFARPDELIILATPAAAAALDVQALAPIFHLDKADVPARIVLIPKDKWKIPGAQAILTTTDFFQCFDVLETILDQDNNAQLYSNKFLHIHQIIAYSRFVPAVLFWTGPGTDEEELVSTVTGLSATTIYDMDETVVTSVERGGVYNLSTVAQGTGETLDTGVGYALAVPGSSRQTRMGGSGVLLVGADEKSEKLSVLRFSTQDTNVRSVQEIDVTGDIYEMWPKEVTPDPDAS